jgi:hypothetical protein
MAPPKVPPIAELKIRKKFWLKGTLAEFPKVLNNCPST